MATVKLTIDGKPIEVPAGTTIFDAARQLTINIPPICNQHN
jgi:NADH dehydrogenase/NADH:ubiquinone oxidoreductase subunit G